MQIVLSLSLPRDKASVPMVRHVCRGALTDLGVQAECISDVEVAVTEACSNVFKHALGGGQEYAVEVTINDARCEIRVTDSGQGFEVAAPGSSMTSEDGRGIMLMRALVDELEFTSEPTTGTTVHLVKRLDLEDGSVLAPSTYTGSEAAGELGEPG